VIVFDAALNALMAQNPFGGPRPPAEPQVGGIIGWILAKQSEFYREMSTTIRAAKSDGSAVWTLLGISFAYGIFHAAGPGHGKAVISSYLVANEETARRGIVLSFASAALQAATAIALVGIGIANQFFFMAANPLIQTTSSPAIRGRVMAVWVLVLLGGQGIGGPVMGWIVDVLGPRGGMFLSGAVPALAEAVLGIVIARQGELRLAVRWRSPLHPVAIRSR